MSQYIDIAAADGPTFRGYLALPPSGQGPGIVLCQEIFGINDYVREVADLGGTCALESAPVTAHHSNGA